MPKRSKARALALQIIFQLQVQAEKFLDQVDDFVKEAALDSSLSSYARQLAVEAWQNRAEADELIVKFAPHWPVANLPAVDLAIIRLAVCELFHHPEVPPKVAIDEAIKLAKIYSTERSSSFINGLLDTIMKSTVTADKSTGNNHGDIPTRL